jgi:hypothetical protein
VQSLTVVLRPSHLPLAAPATQEISVEDNDIAPIASAAISPPSLLPPGVTTFANKASREAWAKTHLDSAVLAQLNQPFGKDTSMQSVTVVAAFRHVLCSVIISAFLDDVSLAALETASVPARWFLELQ